MEMIMMMDPAVKCLCLLAVVAILFVTETSAGSDVSFRSHFLLASGPCAD